LLAAGQLRRKQIAFPDNIELIQCVTDNRYSFLPRNIALSQGQFDIFVDG
jgi:hypothetical protein